MSTQNTDCTIIWTISADYYDLVMAARKAEVPHEKIERFLQDPEDPDNASGFFMVSDVAGGENRLGYLAVDVNAFAGEAGLRIENAIAALRGLT